jgi:hypothetical protein
MTRLFTTLCLTLQVASAVAGDLNVYPPVPGLDASAHDQVRLRNPTFENLTLGGKPVTDASFFKRRVREQPPLCAQ